MNACSIKTCFLWWAAKPCVQSHRRDRLHCRVATGGGEVKMAGRGIFVTEAVALGFETMGIGSPLPLGSKPKADTETAPPLWGAADGGFAVSIPEGFPGQPLVFNHGELTATKRNALTASPGLIG